MKTELLTYFGSKSPKVLFVIGGHGDSVSYFSPFLKYLASIISGYQIVAVDLTFESDTNIFEIQTKEIREALETLVRDQSIDQIDVFATSMGAYGLVKALQDNTLVQKTKKIILFDPANYYLSETKDKSISGFESFDQARKTIALELGQISGNFKVDVIHLTIKNYSSTGYLEENPQNRGVSKIGGYPRLNTESVTQYWDQLPFPNKGDYLEIDDIPHAILRDGDIEQNLRKIVKVVSKSLNII